MLLCDITQNIGSVWNLVRAAPNGLDDEAVTPKAGILTMRAMLSPSSVMTVTSSDGPHLQ